MQSTRLMALLVCLACAAPGRAMTIIANFEASVPTAAQTVFNNIVSAYDLLFANPITVTIDVAFGATGLGSSSTYIGTASYSDWRSAMTADSAANPANAYLAAGVATLPATNPLGSGSVVLTYADAMALGFSVSPVTYDSTLTFTNVANMFEYNSVATPGLYDFQDVAEHELDEALGIGSALTGIANGGALPRNFDAEDYFRYNASGARWLTTSASAVVDFSYDGVTDVAQFNQNNAYGDRNDWVYADSGCPASSPGPYIQDAIGCPDSVVHLIRTSPEVVVLQTLGYDLSTPEPASMALAAAGLAALALFRRNPAASRGRPRLLLVVGGGGLLRAGGCHGGQFLAARDSRAGRRPRSSDGLQAELAGRGKLPLRVEIRNALEGRDPHHPALVDDALRPVRKGEPDSQMLANGQLAEVRQLHRVSWNSPSNWPSSARAAMASWQATQ
ncbi:MAG: NF038122 family metalloprotease [Bryobacteraceae bacterium]|jgi:hypothetical protein